ncbi:MAG: PIN domain-containing protein [Balneolaceae bacterium]|nr:PIN domain-containing protein [Balneolaceae bacterium]
MKVLFDTNILLDLFLERAPFYEHSAHTIGLAEQNKIEGWVCGTTVTTIHYLIGKTISKTQANSHIHSLLKIFNISPVNRAVLESAVTAQFPDFEDAVLYQSALQTGVDAVLTRNTKDFVKSELPVYTSIQLLHILKELK